MEMMVVVDAGKASPRALWLNPGFRLRVGVIGELLTAEGNLLAL